MDISRITMTYETASTSVLGAATAQGLLHVPQGLPAATRVLSIEGRATAAATADDGSVSANGSVTLNVIYEDENGEVYGFESVAAFAHEEEAKKATKGALCCVDVAVCEIQHAVAAGAVDVHVELMLRFTVYNRAITSAVSSLSDATVQVKKKTHTYYTLEATKEELGLSDEVRLPRTAERLLVTTASAGIRGVTAEGDSALVNGVLKLCVCYLAADKTPVQSPFSLPFEASVATSSGTAFARVRLLSLETTLVGEDGISVEAAVELTVFSVCKREAELAVDAYSLTHALVPESEGLLVREDAGTTCRTSQRFEIPTPQDMPDAERVLFASLRPAVASAVATDGAVKLSGSVYASVIYMCGEGKLHSANSTMPFECECEARYAAQNSAVHVDVICETIHANGSSNAIFAQIAIECALVVSTTKKAKVMTGVTAGALRQGAYGPVVYFPTNDETAWDIGRRFGVTIEELLANNPGLENSVPAAVLVNMRRTG